jgi:hypothetical protein
MSILRHWKMILGLLALFAAGVATGMVLAVGGIMKIVSHQSKPEVWVKGRVAELNHALALSPEQQAKTKPILENSAKRVREVIAEGFGKMLAIVQDTHEEINNELTPEQQKKWGKLRQEHLKRWREFAAKEAAKAPPKPL